MPAELHKKKDAWDKAQILSGFISSVVIATVGILINNSIQRAQIASSQANTSAQIQVAERNNKAQLELTERTAEIQRHLQEGTLTGQLVEHLAGGSKLKKQVAIVALRRSIPPEMYQDVITIIVRADADPDVRKTALEQARTLRDVAPTVVQAITEAAADSSRAQEERNLAKDTVRQIGLASASPATTIVFSSGQSEQRPDLRGSVFTSYLLRGLSGEASSKKDGNVGLSELDAYVRSNVKIATEGRERPIVAFPSAMSVDPIIVGPNANYSKTVSVAIGNGAYRNARVDLAFSASDAQAFGTFWKNRGARTQILVEASGDQMRRAIVDATAQADRDSLQIIYYSGHTVNDANGSTYLLPVDADIGADDNRLRQTSISAAELRDRLSRSPARTQILFFDTGFSAPILGNK